MSTDFDQLIADNQTRVWHIAHRYSDGADVDDLYQEILLQVFRSLSQFNGLACIDTWIYRVALNTAMSYQRKVIKHKQVKAKALHVAAPQVELQGESHDVILSQFFAELGALDRAILTLYIDGASTEIMADVLEIKAATIKVRVSRLKQKFSQRFVD